MYKKIVLVLSALIIFSLPYQQQYTEAAILSKVASKGAQKVVKEVIKETAFDLAIDMFVNEAYKMAAEEQAKYKAQSDYELFCGKKMPDLITCEKPMQVKKVLTSADKTNIGNQAEIELDKLITNGKGFTRWQKFLDWFLPIWVASLTLTAITYAVDPEVRSLFNEAAYNALVALGLIKPVIDQTQLAEQEPKTTYETTPSTGTSETTDTKQITVVDTGSPTDMKLSSLAIDVPNTVLETTTHTAQDRNRVQLFYVEGSTYTEIINLNFNSSSISFYPTSTVVGTTPMQLVIQKNGTTVYNASTVNYTFSSIPTENLSAIQTKTQSIRTRLPYKFGDFYYTDVLLFTTEGDTFHYQIRMDNHKLPTNITSYNVLNYRDSPTSATETFIAHKNKSPYKKIIVPLYDEIQEDINVPKTKYEDENEQIALIPPGAIPIIQTSTGIQLEQEIGEDGEPKYKVPGSPQGEYISEDDITVGEPNVQDNPSPQPNTVTPPATQTNPNPQPIPLTPTTPTPTPTPTPPIETEPPKFPEGESCSEGLKLPKIKPLTQAVTTAFPFSIPFDLYKGFQALFSEIGTEKPSFNLVIGDQVDWKITIPDYFDSWKTFSDGMLIFVFDVGLIYAIYRFMNGGGS